MWVDYRGSLSTVYNDGEISTCGWIIEVHSVQYLGYVDKWAAIHFNMYENSVTHVQFVQIKSL